MLVCNNCNRTEDIVKVVKKTSICISCGKKIWRVKNKETIKEKNKEYYKVNRETILLNKKIYYGENKEDIIGYRKEYYFENKEIIIDKVKKYNKNNESIKDYKKVYNRKYYEENKEVIKEYSRDYNKEYYKNNKESIKEYKRKYYESNKRRLYDNHRYRLSNDPIYKLSHTIRNSIRSIFRYNSIIKKSKTIEILGCSFEEFKLYLESKFEPWMNWENKGLYNGEFNYGWDIDHIIPLASAETEEDILRLNHYTNLQPLCSKVNRDIKRDIF